VKYIRNIRRTITRDRKNLIGNLLWFLAGIAALPTIASIFGWLSELPVPILSSSVLIESLTILLLIFSLMILRDKLSLATDYFKRNSISWAKLEDDDLFSDGFNKAIKESAEQNHTP